MSSKGIDLEKQAFTGVQTSNRQIIIQFLSTFQSLLGYKGVIFNLYNREFDDLL